MSLNSKNYVKVKALSFINKLSEYLTKSIERDQVEPENFKSDSSIKEKRRLKKEPETLPYNPDSGESEQLKGGNNKSFPELSTDDDNRFQESLRKSIIKKLWPKSDQPIVSSDNMKGSVKIKGATDFNFQKNDVEKTESLKEITNLFNDNQNQNFVIMKADTFKGKVTTQGKRTKPVKNPEVPIKEHRIFINSKKARELGLYQKFYLEKIPELPARQNTVNKPVEIPVPDQLKFFPEEEQIPVKPAEPQIPATTPLPENLKMSVPVPEKSKKIELETLPPPKNLRIFEEGIFLGLKIGESTRAQVIESMKPFSDLRFDPAYKESVLDYKDLSFLIYFDDRGIINEFEFNTNFPGTTQKGLKVGDTIEKAVKIYGPPGTQTENEALWPNMKIIFNKFYIISIKISKTTQYISDKKLLVRNFNIYTEGLLIGIIVGESTNSVIVGGHNRAHVLQFMKDYSSSNDVYTTGSNLDYKDIGITVYFDNSDIVNSIYFANNFIGSTVRGLKIGDSIEKAIKIYGEPDIKNDELVSWNKFKIYCRDNKVNSFKIHS